MGKAILEDGIDLYTSNYEEAISLTDLLSYPLDVQHWLNPDDAPILSAIAVYSARASLHPHIRDNWEKLIVLTDALNEEDEKDHSDLFNPGDRHTPPPDART